jgi:long-chain acyl-CoA synthetase
MGQFPVYEVLREAASRWPDRPAIFDEYGELSFAGLFAQAEVLRLELEALGMREGMGVGLKARNGRQFLIGLFAIVGCGAAVMPIYHQLKKIEVDALIEEAQLHGLLDDGSGFPSVDHADTIIPQQTGSFQFKRIAANQQKVFAPQVQMPALVRFTSGTTGKSKGVVISHRSAIERIEAGNKGLCLGPADTVIWVLPMAYHFVVSIILYVRFGAAIAVVKDFLAKNTIETTNRHQGTLLYASPLQIRLLAHDSGAEMMPSLIRVISTSAGIAPEVCEAFKKRFGKDVSQAYGIIEIGLPMINSLQQGKNLDAVGRTLPDYSAVIFDDQFQKLPTGRIGQLAIKGPGMFDAYLSPAQVRSEVLVQGYFLTADYASISEEGLIKIEGRSKSVINISGIKIFPEEIEGVLETIPGIKLARISSSPHPLLGQIIEGEIVLEQGAAIDIEEVLTYCRARLSNFKTPQNLKIVSELPVTATGKLRRD